MVSFSIGATGPWRRISGLLLRFQESFQFAHPGRMPEFAQSFGFDLTDSFACYRELFTDFLQRP
jgi:hypothetical protein